MFVRRDGLSSHSNFQVAATYTGIGGYLSILTFIEWNMDLVPDIKKLGNVCWAHDLLHIVKPISQVTQIIHVGSKHKSVWSRSLFSTLATHQAWSAAPCPSAKRWAQELSPSLDIFIVTRQGNFICIEHSSKKKMELYKLFWLFCILVMYSYCVLWKVCLWQIGKQKPRKNPNLFDRSFKGHYTAQNCPLVLVLQIKWRQNRKGVALLMAPTLSSDLRRIPVLNGLVQFHYWIILCPG